MLERVVIRVLMILLVCLVWFAGVAEAANRKGAMTFSPSVGAHIFEGNEEIKNSTEFGLGIGYNFTENWAFELNTSYYEMDLRSPGTAEFNTISARFDLLYHFQPEEKLVPYFAIGAGGVSIGEDPNVTPHDNEDYTANYGFGLKYFTTDWIGLRADVRHLFRFDYDDAGGSYNDKYYNNVIVSAGFIFQSGGEGTSVPPVVDADDDGIVDSRDRCLDTPPGYNVDSYGCPIDTDADGVVDAEDLCPDTVAGTEVDDNGCPLQDEEPVADSDGDGVSDMDDKCPNTPEGIPVNSYGCPSDSDGDTVFDVDDDCPNTPTGIAVGPDGCGPDEVNIKLRSEDDASKAEAFRSEHPEGAALAALAEKDSLNLDIQFAPNKSIIKSGYNADLKQAAAFIAAHPGVKIVVEGHTDSTGSKSLNQKLSQKRADTVRWILVRDYGVDKSRVVAKGYGESQPIADNNTQQGRAQNRRVLIKVAE